MRRFLPAALLLGALAVFLVLRFQESAAPAVPPDSGAVADSGAVEEPALLREPDGESAGEPEPAELSEDTVAEAMAAPEDGAGEANGADEEHAESIEGVVSVEAEASAEEVVVEEPEPETVAEVSSFDELRVAIDGLMDGRAGRVSVAVLSGSGLHFSYDGSGTYPLASVAKLYIMTGYLDYLAQQDREPDETEAYLLESMIGWSDNYAAEEIWQYLGRTEAMQLYLQSRGFYGLVEADDGSWGGASTTTADTALFLRRLAAGELLDPERTDYAMSLLGKVEAGQRWGVTAGIAATDPEATILLKDGWYPDLEGWRVNSAGLVFPSNGAAPYSIVIFTDGLDTYGGGVRLVENIARLANGLMLRPEAVSENGE